MSQIELNWYRILAYSIIALFGFFVGIVQIIFIRCYPRIQERSWYQDCQEFLGLSCHQEDRLSSCKIFNSCAHCHQPLNYFISQGKCQHCRTPREKWPFLVIFFSIVVSLAPCFFFQKIQLLAGTALLSYGFICLAFIDYREKYLPDEIIYIFLWVGLLLNAYHFFFASINDAIAGAVVPYLVLWIFLRIIRFFKKQFELGLDGFKMISLIGAWVGLSNLMLPIVLAIILQVTAVLIHSPLSLKYLKEVNFRYPLGPSFALGAFLAIYRFGNVLA